MHWILIQHIRYAVKDKSYHVTVQNMTAMHSGMSPVLEASVEFVFNNTQRNRGSENSQPSRHEANICELTQGLRQEKANVPVL